MEWKVPFNKPYRNWRQSPDFDKVIESGKMSGDGPMSEWCTNFLQERIGAKKVFLTPSCTHALEMAMMLVSVYSGHRVIMPSFAFPSLANAVILRGATPLFCDIRKDTLNIDEEGIEKCIYDGDYVHGLIIIHYGGIACDMDAIKSVLHDGGYEDFVYLIEDMAHALFGSYDGESLGSFGDMACMSFHETKNFTCGEGGAIAINDKKFIERAEIIREKGTNRKVFQLGLVDKYTWVDVGSSWLMSEFQAAMLKSQLEEYKIIQYLRRNLWACYKNELKDWTENNGIQLPFIPANCKSAWHNFWMLLPNKADRDDLLHFLNSHGVMAVFHYQPLHLSPMGEKLGYQRGQFPVTEMVADCIVRLPFYTDMIRDEQDYVIEKVMAWRK